MERISHKHHLRTRRHARVRSQVIGTSARPRLSVFRSLKYIRAQVIDDVAGKTLVSAVESELKTKGTKTERAKALGLLLAEKTKTANITTVVFDRGGNAYHGRVKALAEGAREGGLIF